VSDASDWLLARLADEGVEVVFGNPGSTELPLVDAFPRQDRVRFVLGLHESSVVGMADGYAQQGDRLGVVNVHVQPGLANAMSGILNAARARVPLLVTVGQQVTSLLDRAPFLGGELVELARPIAKAAWEVGRDGDLQELVERAISAATTHPRGPVVLSLPMDLLVAAPPDATAGAAELPRTEEEEEGLDRAAGLLRSADAPVVVAGDGVVHEGCWDDVLTVAERLGAPILGEPFAARAPVPSDHPLWMGPLPGFASEIAAKLAPYDVMLAVGMPVFRVFGDSPGEALPAGIRLVHLEVDPEEIGRNHDAAVGVAGPVARSLRRIADALAAPSPRVEARAARTAAGIADDRVEALVRVRELAEAPAVSPARFCLAIAGAVARDDLVVDEALTSGRWLRTALGGRNTPRTWLAHRGSALGWGLPAAVGAKLADPSRRVMCVHGDGSFLFGVHALWTAARERLGLAVVVADNGGYEILRAGLEGLTGRPEGGWPGLAISDPAIDLVAVSRGFGASAERIDRREGVDDALRDLWARAEDGPAVLVVPVTGRTPAVGYPLGPPAATAR
jgi:benzoylformate decarboxylase